VRSALEASGLPFAGRAHHRLNTLTNWVPIFPGMKRASARPRWPRGAAALILALSLGLTACTGAAADSVRSPGPSPSPAAARATPPASEVDKVFLIVEENRSVQDVETHMPFLMSQARTYGTATNFYAITHPSLPNYLVLAGGSTFGITDDDDDPGAHQLEGPSLFGQLVSAGRTAKTYAEAMQTNCARENHGTYAVRHNPWTYFDEPAERSSCDQFDVPSGSPTAGALVDDITAGNLPTFGLLVPDICHDGHDCSAAITDDWLQSWLLTIKNGPDFALGRLAIVITWDEDDDHSGNQVPMVVIHPSLKDRQVTTRLDHYGVSASISRIGGIPLLRDANNRTDALAAFGL
jgi:phosphatidylinositol-3-phosphatase